MVGALAFKFIGGNVKHAGSKTNEQFAGGGEADKSKGPSETKGKADKDKGKSGDKSASGGGTEGTQAGGASGGGSGGAQAAQNDTSGASSGGDEQAQEQRKTPLWKILGGVFVLLFAIGGYFAFRKTKSAG